MKINKKIFDNGLRLVHNEDTSTQMVALNIVYDVGARDEHPEHTGFAHLFEHLMFGGSVHIPDYDAPLQLAGGENNAWTNNDITNYYLTVPKSNVEIGFWLESDRMLELAFSEQSLEVQRAVVMEEFKQRCLNQPYGDVGHLLRPLAYQTHPYRWPTIGKDLSHIANATLDEVKEFFFRFYAPNNAVLAVTGNISWEETVRLTEKWFAPIPRRNVPVRQLPQEVVQTAERRQTVERNVPLDALFMAYHMCSREDARLLCLRYSVGYSEQWTFQSLDPQAGAGAEVLFQSRCLYLRYTGCRPAAYQWKTICRRIFGTSRGCCPERVGRVEIRVCWRAGIGESKEQV